MPLTAVSGARLKIWRSILVAIGTIVGAGIFGLPAMFGRIGFWPGTCLYWFMALVILALHLLFVDITLAFRERHRLTGYGKLVLGRVGFWIPSVTYPLAMLGGLFAYLLLGGQFLADIGHLVGLEGGLLLWQMLFWMVGAITVLFGLKLVAKVEVWATWALIVTMVIVSVVGLSFWKSDAMRFTDWSGILIPFGIFLFSLMGLSVIGEVVELVARRRRDAMLAVTIGTLSAALLAWLFGIGVFVGGRSLTLSPVWIWLIPIVGLLAVATSFIAVAQDLKATWHLDFHFSKHLAWVMALFPPLVFLFVLKRDFLSTLDIVGSLFWGVNGMLVAVIALKTVKQRQTHNCWWAYVVPLLVLVVFGIGFIQKVWYHQGV